MHTGKGILSDRNGPHHYNAGETLLHYADTIEEALAAYLPTGPYPESKVAGAMAYSLLGGGKRIRGALVLAFYSLYHEDIKPVLPFACALEMVHAYSLIHDDLPCMDDDDLRRGKPSCHIAYGEATALLAGDALLALAFEVTANPMHAIRFHGANVLKAIHSLAYAAGLSGMVGGQIIDLEQEGKETPLDLLDRMYMKKTGALLVAAAQIGCLLGGAGEDDTAAAAEYASRTGTAFQIVDDILDITGDEVLLGKPVGSDEENAKSTYVALLGLDQSRQEVRSLTEQAKKALGRLPGDTRFLMGLADLLTARQK